MIKINRFRSLLVILMAAALSVSFASCSDDKDDGNVSLEGTWTGETMKYQYILTFNADGTYYQEGNFVPQEPTEDIKHDLRESGNYVVDGKKMTMTATMFQVYDKGEKAVVLRHRRHRHEKSGHDVHQVIATPALPPGPAN